MSFMNVAKMWNAMLDAVMPRRGRSVRTAQRSLGHMPLQPTIHEMSGARITTIMDYRESAARDAIQALKYDGSAHAAELCAEALEDFLREEIAAAKSFSARDVLLVPIPLHRSRHRERGFNQIEVVLKKLPQEFRDGSLSTVAPHALSRIRATEQQTHLSRDERIKNVEEAFAVVSHDIVRNAHVFLIDDVTTTGATLLNAAKRLEQAGATVSLIALARA